MPTMREVMWSPFPKSNEQHFRDVNTGGEAVRGKTMCMTICCAHPQAHFPGSPRRLELRTLLSFTNRLEN